MWNDAGLVKVCTDFEQLGRDKNNPPKEGSISNFSRIPFGNNADVFERWRGDQASAKTIPATSKDKKLGKTKEELNNLDRIVTTSLFQMKRQVDKELTGFNNRIEIVESASATHIRKLQERLRKMEELVIRLEKENRDLRNETVQIRLARKTSNSIPDKESIYLRSKYATTQFSTPQRSRIRPQPKMVYSAPVLIHKERSSPDLFSQKSYPMAAPRTLTSAPNLSLNLSTKTGGAHCPFAARVFVGQVPSSLSDEKIQLHFSKFGVF
mmetsp:Transcript_5662/g.7886  ORF Transcript_5662/g.7886 Transcript_5662/m.7886 type:complete len:267 (-) Transcript_5662:1134-1934(-)